MQKITTFLWFKERAEEAADLYISVFPNSRVLETLRAGPDGPVISMTAALDGQEFMLLNGGPTYSFTPAISLLVKCNDQAEVDHYWDALTANGGKPEQCGWLTDPFGVSWQIIPDALAEALGNPDPAMAQAAMEAMLRMTKIDIAALEAAVA